MAVFRLFVRFLFSFVSLVNASYLFLELLIVCFIVIGHILLCCLFGFPYCFPFYNSQSYSVSKGAVFTMKWSVNNS